MKQISEVEENVHVALNISQKPAVERGEAGGVTPPHSPPPYFQLISRYFHIKTT
jgi:hypothetical protein